LKNIIKDKLFDAINKIELISRDLGLPPVTIPNIGVTVNNKILEFSRQFENAGISMY
jgi:hypothetical protein